MPPRAKPSWFAIGASLVGLLAAGGWVGWKMRVEAIEQELTRKQGALKTLHLSGRLPPNREATEYLESRTAALEIAYQTALKLTTVSSMVSERHADPQLYFQQRVHEIQRTLDRLTAARGMKSPEHLGLPKELPPVDVVPRLLLQLELIKDASELVMAQGITQLSAVKVEDPQILPGSRAGGAGGPARGAGEQFLMRLPVRLRLSCSLETLTRVLGVLDRAKPMIDLQAMRLRLPADGQGLEVELVVARYLATSPQLTPAEEEPTEG